MQPAEGKGKTGGCLSYDARRCACEYVERGDLDEEREHGEGGSAATKRLDGGPCFFYNHSLMRYRTPLR